MLFPYSLDWGSWLTKAGMSWLSLSFLWSAALTPTCKGARGSSPGCESKPTVMAVFRAQTNKLLLPFIQSFRIYKEERWQGRKKNGQDEKGKVFIHNFLSSVVLYYAHIVMFRRSLTPFTGSALGIACRPLRHCRWAPAMPPSTGWNLFCIISVLSFTILCS